MIKLIDEWRKAWKWFSVQAMGLAIAIQGAWAAVPDSLQSAVPHSIVTGVTMALLVLGIAGRLVDQAKPGMSDAGNP